MKHPFNLLLWQLNWIYTSFYVFVLTDQQGQLQRNHLQCVVLFLLESPTWAASDSCLNTTSCLTKAHGRGAGAYILTWIEYTTLVLAEMLLVHRFIWIITSHSVVTVLSPGSWTEYSLLIISSNGKGLVCTGFQVQLRCSAIGALWVVWMNAGRWSRASVFQHHWGTDTSTQSNNLENC